MAGTPYPLSQFSVCLSVCLSHTHISKMMQGRLIVITEQSKE